MLMTGSDSIDAERAFARSARARRRAAVLRRLRRGSAPPARAPPHAHTPAPGARLAFSEGRSAAGARVDRGIREIPLCAIRGTLEPSRARMFDGAFHPAAAARSRGGGVGVARRRGG